MTKFAVSQSSLLSSRLATNVPQSTLCSLPLPGLLLLLLLFKAFVFSSADIQKRSLTSCDFNAAEKYLIIVISICCAFCCDVVEYSYGNGCVFLQVVLMSYYFWTSRGHTYHISDTNHSVKSYHQLLIIQITTCTIMHNLLRSPDVISTFKHFQGKFKDLFHSLTDMWVHVMRVKVCVAGLLGQPC